MDNNSNKLKLTIKEVKTVDNRNKTFAYLKLEPAIIIYETIIGVFVAYAIFVYEYLVTFIFSIKKINTLQNFKKLAGWKGLMKYIEVRSMLVLLRVAPIIGILLLVSFDFSHDVNSSTLLGVLGGITGAWALFFFFTYLGINEISKETNQSDSFNINEAIFTDLYNQPEYIKRNTLANSEYYMLAHLTPNQFVHIAIPNQSINQLLQITVQDSQKIIKLKSGLYSDPKERWFKGFVYMRRRIQGHLFFAAGTGVSISMIMFDKSNYLHEETVDPFFNATFLDNLITSIVLLLISANFLCSINLILSSKSISTDP